MFNISSTGSAMRRPSRVRAILGAFGVAVLLGMTPLISATGAGAADAMVTLPSLAPLVEKVKPAVVNISTTQKPDRTRGASPFPPGSPEDQFFRRFFGDQGPNRRGGPEIHALGSGFIVDADGYVVTNNHVIEGAQEIKVIASDGETYSASLIGTDGKTDIALLKIDAGKPLPFVNFGDSDAALVGDWVLAVGNPFGLGGSVTMGIVSARGRDIGASAYDDFLQIDAPINSGNSGGPTFNLKGEVIGINTAIYSPNGGSVGIGFAIPAALAKPVVEDLKASGKVQRGWLGVEIQEVSSDIAKSLGMDKPRGALIANVLENSPAAKAGVRDGDLITEVNGKAIDEMRQLPREIAQFRAGDKVDLTIHRAGGKVENVQVVIGAMPDEGSRGGYMSGRSSGSSTLDNLGLALSPLTSKERKELNLRPSLVGVLISEVIDGSPAAEKGIQPGDVIVAVNQEAVAKPDDVVTLVEKTSESGKSNVLFLINRGGKQRYIAIPFGR